MTLKEALDALVALATTAGVDPAVARTEGESLAATVAEPARGAYVDWCAETGHGTAEDFTTAASRGRRYRVAQTPSMAALASSGSAHAAAYAQALSDVALAGSLLGEENARSIGNAATAAAAQLGGPGQVAPVPLPTTRDRVPGVADHFLAQVMEQSRVVREKLAALEGTPIVRDPSVGLDERSHEPPAPVQAAPPPEPVEAPAEPAEREQPAKSVEELLAELDDLVGLTDVKAEIHRQAAVLRVEGLRAEAGLEGLTITRHLIFNGNPGTGKTTVARLVAGIYRALGLLSKGQLVEVDRSELVAGYLGQTAMKTAEVVKSAIGGVLFIDEAYSLAGDQYGQEAIDTLVKEMEDHRGDLVVIVAGYPLPMAVFIGQNPGLESRFRTEIDFPDYTDDELVSIFEVMASGAQYDAGEDVQARLRELLAQVERGPSFGNARYVRNVLEAAIGRHAWRLREVEAPTLEQLRLLLSEDLAAPAEVVEPFGDPVDPVDQTDPTAPTDPADPAEPAEEQS
ncbi:AAA family ATPase [Nocardioides currus]|uniref:AAA family ATPase n=1 Tax=Nocardioides currus TaxID=2133958 RepID=A0A2R7YUE4_9ACTN|nr:AAA family ATPase [Nocardioides currus]PUA79924.1 AAA family ATPase [Nocardioides currus]